MISARWYLLVFLAGCAVDASGLPRGPRDLGFEAGAGLDGGVEARDGGRADTGTDAGLDVGRDARMPDARPLDVGPPDSGADLGPPDIGPPDMGPPPFCAPTAGLVGCYTFDSAAAPFLDGSGSGNDLMASTVTVGAGAIGSAAYLNDASALRVADSVSLDPSSAFSAELWVWIDAFPTNGRAGLLDKDGQFGIFAYPGGLLRCTGGGGLAETTGLPSAAWQHVACTHDGSTLRLYVDGTERATGAAGPPGPGTAALHLGEDSPGGGDQLRGRLDEVRLWTRALPPTRITRSATRR